MGKSTNISPSNIDSSPSNLVVHVTLDADDSIAVNLLYITNVIRISVVRLCGIIPVEYNDIADFRLHRTILVPNTHCLKKLNMLLTSDFCSDQINGSCLDCAGRYKAVTPRICILDGVSTGKRLVRIIEIQNLFILTVCFRETKPSAGHVQNLFGCYASDNFRLRIFGLYHVLVSFGSKIVVHINVTADSGNTPFTCILVEITRVIGLTSPVSQPFDILIQKCVIVPVTVIVNIEIDTCTISKRLHRFAERLCVSIAFRFSECHTGGRSFRNRVILEIKKYNGLFAKTRFLKICNCLLRLLLCLLGIQSIRKVVNSHDGKPHFFAFLYVVEKPGIDCLPITFTDNHKIDSTVLDLPGINISLPDGYIYTFLLFRHFSHPLVFNCFFLAAFRAELRLKISRLLIFLGGEFLMSQTLIRVNKRLRCHFWHSNGIFKAIIQ